MKVLANNRNCKEPIVLEYLLEINTATTTIIYRLIVFIEEEVFGRVFYFFSKHPFKCQKLFKFITKYIVNIYIFISLSLFAYFNLC